MDFIRFKHSFTSNLDSNNVSRTKEHGLHNADLKELEDWVLINIKKILIFNTFQKAC
jgi:hypothetical protein